MLYIMYYHITAAGSTAYNDRCYETRLRYHLPCGSDESVSRGGARLAGRRRRACERVRGMSESPQATSESAGEGVAVSGARVSQVVSIILPQHTYRIGWGGCGGNWCLATVESYCLQSYRMRTRLGHFVRWCEHEFTSHH